MKCVFIKNAHTMGICNKSKTCQDMDKIWMILQLNANATVFDSINMKCSVPLQSVENESWLLNI